MLRMKTIDLRSDTVTRPTAAMREAIARAAVGDDVYGEDPSVNQLQAVAAARLGKEAAIFMPSGTMANQAAIRALTRHGDVLLAGAGAHLLRYESGAAAALSGVQIQTIGDDGLFDGEDVVGAIPPRDHHRAPVTLVTVENTHNAAGGRLFPFERLRRVVDAARTHGLRLHLDGARLFNAVVATGIPAERWTAGFDTVSVCLSKGLGAPVGSVVCGSAEVIDAVHRVRKMLGGGMRQAGILAAAGSYALEHHVERLGEDHRNARRLAEGLMDLELELVRPPETNMVFFHCPAPHRLATAMRARGILVNQIDERTLRAVTHLDVSREDVEVALERIADVFK
jgi:threonine aldolase